MVEAWLVLRWKLGKAVRTACSLSEAVVNSSCWYKVLVLKSPSSLRGQIQRKAWCMGVGVPELTITSPYVHSRVDSNTFNTGNPMPESTLTLCQSRLYPPFRDFGFGLRSRVGMQDRNCSYATPCRAAVQKRGLNTGEAHDRLLFFWVPRNLSPIDRQARIGDTLLVKSRG
jgi:hypothetical protein